MSVSGYVSTDVQVAKKYLVPQAGVPKIGTGNQTEVLCRAVHSG